MLWYRGISYEYSIRQKVSQLVKSDICSSGCTLKQGQSENEYSQAHRHIHRRIELSSTHQLTWQTPHSRMGFKLNSIAQSYNLISEKLSSSARWYCTVGGYSGVSARCASENQNPEPRTQERQELWKSRARPELATRSTSLVKTFAKSRLVVTCLRFQAKAHSRKKSTLLQKNQSKQSLDQRWAPKGRWALIPWLCV